MADKKFVCGRDGCTSSYTTKPSLIEHVNARHNGILLRCSLCNKPYKTQRRLRDHMATHGLGKPQTKSLCPFQGCGYKVSRKDNVQRHIHTCSKRPAELAGVAEEDLPQPLAWRASLEEPAAVEVADSAVDGGEQPAIEGVEDLHGQQPIEDEGVIINPQQQLLPQDGLDEFDRAVFVALVNNLHPTGGPALEGTLPPQEGVQAVETPSVQLYGQQDPEHDGQGDSESPSSSVSYSYSGYDLSEQQQQFQGHMPVPGPFEAGLPYQGQTLSNGAWTAPTSFESGLSFQGQIQSNNNWAVPGPFESGLPFLGQTQSNGAWSAVAPFESGLSFPGQTQSNGNWTMPAQFESGLLNEQTQSNNAWTAPGPSEAELPFQGQTQSYGTMDLDPTLPVLPDNNDFAEFAGNQWTFGQ